MKPEAPPLVHLAVLTDSGYAMPTAVMLTSAKHSKKPESRYCVHLCMTEEIEGYEARMASLLAPDFEIRFHRMELSHFEGLATTYHVTHTTLAKFDLSSELEEEKVLYLDGDLLVCGDLTELYNTPLGDKLLAACADAGSPIPWAREMMGDERYINAGVMLMNLRQMRQENLPERFLRARQEAPESWRFMDQDIFNAVCKGRIHYLPLRYNYLISLAHANQSLEALNAMFGSHYMSWRELEEDVAIVHLAGGSKPWCYVDAPASDLWMHYYHCSPYARVALVRGSCQAEVVAEGIAERWGAPRPRVCIRLFGFLPLLTVRSRPGKVQVKLFGFVPLLSYSRKHGCSCVRLCGLLPLWTTRG